MTVVEIIEAQPDQAPALTAMFQLYWHDFSRFLPHEDAELAEDGRFGPPAFLDRYWRNEERLPLLIRVGGRLAGFALLNRYSRIGDPPDRAMAEFFVVRRHRRTGVGTIAARLIFDRYPGQWEVAVMRENRAALAFWKRAIRDHAGASAIVERSGRDGDWNGTLFRFHVDPERIPAPLA